MSLYKRIQIIINPAAGQDKAILGPMNKAFHEAGIDWDVSITKKAGDAKRLAQEAVQAGVNAVGVYGGDGTVMEVASGLIGTEIPLAIFPGGTANVMSVELGIPNDIAEATALVCKEESEVRCVDMGQIGEHYFLLRVGIGAEAEMVNNADREMKNRLGVLAYALTAVQAIQNPVTAKYRMILDGEEIIAEGITCIINNSGSFGRPGLTLGPRINVSDGLFDVVVLRDSSLGSLLSAAASVVTGSENTTAMQHWQAKDITIYSDPPQIYQTDGEVQGETPVSVKVLSQVLRVIVPKTAQSDAVVENPAETEAKASA